jgi:hypothetical protein
MPPVHEFVSYVVLTLVFALAGTFGAVFCSELLKVPPDIKRPVKITLRLVVVGNLIALLFALVSLAFCSR